MAEEIRLKRTRHVALLVTLCGLALFYVYLPGEKEPVVQARSQAQVWSVDMRNLVRVAIGLPRQGKAEAWVKLDDQQWYFDRPERPKVDPKRWGGVPLILSGPRAEVVAEGAPDAATVYGFAPPSMTLSLDLADGGRIDAETGDATPDGQARYLRLAAGGVVYAVDRTWHDLLERLVMWPPDISGANGRRSPQLE